MTQLYIRKEAPFELYEVDLLAALDEELMRVSEDRHLGLNLDEMNIMKHHFKKLNRNPFDLEVEALAQSWSEHCSYKTSKPILKRTIFTINAPQSIISIKEDAGVVEFDEDHAYAIKIESHNHPSALDPYGGAATGIGGILRDVLCMGAQPIALVDPLFFARPDYPRDKVPQGTKHPSYLLRGVVDGIAAYGNRVGIPTVAGMIYFDDSYLTNCLVNVGCLGIMKKKHITRSMASTPGHYFMLAGGATGRDGIHGVTFASTELSKESEKASRPAVQMGFPIGKEPLMHACLEAVESGLLSGLKDLGGGGLSCVIGELAYAGGCGASVTLDHVPLKEADMAAWEIWVSESQERMMLVVPPENVEKVRGIFDLWDVPINIVGKVTDTKKLVISHKGIMVCDLNLEFYTGNITFGRPYKKREIKYKEPLLKRPSDLNLVLKRLLASPNIASKEWVIRQYDHEVRGNTVLKPLQGHIWHPGPSDAAVLKPLEHSYKGIAIACDVNPTFCRLDPYWGGASSIEESFRNLVAVGTRPHSIVDCLNFGNPEKQDRLGDFVDVTDGMYHVAAEFGVPFVSGNVSFYNEGGMGSVAPTPTIMAAGITDDVRKCVSSDMKEANNYLYLIGETNNEMNGSEYFKLFDEVAGTVPRVSVQKTKVKINRMLDAIDKRMIRSCHDLSEGGLAVSLTEMLVGTELGAEVNINLIPGNAGRDDYMLFSESNGRWLVEVKPQHAAAFEKMFADTDFKKIGSVTRDSTLRISNNVTQLINIDMHDAIDIWTKALGKLLEGDANA